MPYDEFAGWMNYFERRPIEWRNDLRTAYIMNSFGVKKSPQEIFPSLRSLNSTDNPINSLSKSALFTRMLSAKHGDSLTVLKELK